jgi:hypothetical protein
VLPARAAYWPAGQWMHDVAPSMKEKLPGGHSAHVTGLLAAERVEYVPAAQRLQDQAPLELVNAPAGQDMQRAAPVVGAKKPSGHGRQPLEAARSVNVPLGQGVQDRLPGARE